MLGRVEFKRADRPPATLPSDSNDVLRTQHPSDCAVLQNNTTDELLTFAGFSQWPFLAGMFEFALVSKKFWRLAQSLRLSLSRICDLCFDRPSRDEPQENTPMAKRNRLHFHEWNGAKVIDLGTMEIWDGADLALLRETLTLLIDRQRNHSIGVNMEFVKYIPSGFFGLLFDWREKGIRVQLFNPQPHVQRMLWFQQFMQPVAKGCFLMLADPKQPYLAGSTPPWATTAPIGIEDDDEVEVSPFSQANDDDKAELAFALVGDGEEDDEIESAIDD